jgi:hypothetical protein
MCHYIKLSGMVLCSNGMLLSHFKRNRDAIPPHPTPSQALSIHQIQHTHFFFRKLINMDAIRHLNSTRP